MISVDRALEQLLDSVQPVCTVETVHIQSALSHILAKPVFSTVDVPPADNSSMDGYAVIAAEIEKGKSYKVSQRVTAGMSPKTHISGTATRIFTGAEIPKGADAIIIQENAQSIDAEVTFSETVSTGDNIRKKSQDVTLGAEILSSGIRLRSQEIGLIASCGIQTLDVYKPLRIALVSTGDELVEPGKALLPGQIYNSNKYLIHGLCQQAGFELIDMGTAKDDFETTKTLLGKAAGQADIVITTGGVSVGEEDHVKPAVESLGQLDLWKVAIKPGKPLAFGKIGDTDFIGLPGNPSSVFTTFLILALPRLKRMQGMATENLITTISLPAQFERGDVSRREFLRARRVEGGVEIFPNQSSGVLSSACWGDGFVVQREQSNIEKGQVVEFIPYLNLF